MNGMLLIVVLIMISFGLVMLFSASMSDGYANYGGNSMYYVLKQASITAFGLILAMIIAIGFKVSFFDKFLFSILLYVLTSGLLLYVKFAGQVINNARRWLMIGSFTLQPSELAKLASVFCLAGYFSWINRKRAAGKLKKKGPIRQWLFDGWADILVPGIFMLVWLVLILWQPHLSGFIIMSFIILTVFLASGRPLRSWLSGITQAILILLVLAMLAAAVVPVYLKSKDMDVKDLGTLVEENFAHVEKRIDMFLNPDEASDDDTYQINQAIIAIGSGGLTGVGLGRGRQKYNYLPEAHNDYVFAIIGEELGFFGTLSVLILFVIFLIIGVGISVKARNNYSAVLAAGYTGLISIQALLNIGVATRTLPATGISLPFFSYGGTSNLFFLISIGFLLAVSRTGQRDKTRAAGRIYQ
jgi:cell division protein FtsW